MAKLSDAEKKELLELSRSSQLRHDMRVLRMNQEKLIQDDTSNTVDRYIQFLNETNELMDHKPKKFKEMRGKFFIL